MALAIQAATIPMPWLFFLLVIPALSFIYLMKHYFKKIDCAVKYKSLKQDKKQFFFAPSSLILANYFIAS
ncbi:MAG: hypothetical protein ACI9N3_002391 [Colwellia sp.]|jgi:hypothetical protein